MSHRKTLKQKLPNSKVIIVACEGDAEVSLIEFLKAKITHYNTVRTEPLSGVDKLSGFKTKFNKIIKKCSIHSNRNKEVDFTFIIDNDLEESDPIVKFIKLTGYNYILLDPNMEGFIFSLIGEDIGENEKTKLFRKKCKVNFEKKFGMEACHFKTINWVKIFGDSEERIYLLSKSNATLANIIYIITK